MGRPDDGSEMTIPVNASAPTSMFVFKTIADPFAGRLSLFRVRTGTLKGDTTLANPRSGSTERLGNLSVMQGKQLDQIPELRAGDLGVVAKLKDTGTGDTLADPSHKIRYPPIEFPKPSISFAVEPKSKGDEEKISGALGRLTEEDPVLEVGRDPQTGELLVSGTSQVHVEVAVTKMKKKFGVDAVLKLPKVRYLETITKKVANIEGKHKKQSGGRGQFGVCVIDLAPRPRGEGFAFVDKIFGGSIPQNYRPAVEKGIRRRRREGRARRLPGRSTSGHADRRQVPHGGLLGDGVQDRGIAGLQGGVMSRPGRSCSSRSCPSRSPPPRNAWATSWATCPRAAASRRAWRPGQLPGDQGRGADERDAHLRFHAEIDDLGSRQLPHGIRPLPRGPLRVTSRSKSSPRRPRPRSQEA